MGARALASRLAIHDTDRKSTRLNSSHLGNSYAVFCLKNISHTAIGDAGLEHLRGLAKLQMLELKGTKVTDAGMAHLATLARLQEPGKDKTTPIVKGAIPPKGLPPLTIGVVLSLPGS